jgi:N-acetylmuramoyl-L-alanine amidase
MPAVAASGSRTRGATYRFLVGSLAAVALLPWPSLAGSLPEVAGVRFGVDGRRTRVVIDIDQAVAFSATAENDAPRLVVDLPEVAWRPPRPIPSSRPDGLAKAYRHDAPEPGKARLVVDARAPFRIVHRFALEPDPAVLHHRLVVDLEALGPPAAGFPLGPPLAKPAPEPDAAAPPAVVPRLEPPEPGPPLAMRRTVVLDPGHGGADPGAVGADGSFEKTITLAMARKLRDLLEADGHYRVVLTREDDTRVPLRERVARARAAHADVFLSLHADSLPSTVRGGPSVFILSEAAAGEEAARLLTNGAGASATGDILSSVDLSPYDAAVATILVDLAQRDTGNRSLAFADGLVEELGKVAPLMPRPQRFAGFAVLTSPDTPSVLVELGLLSNRQDARVLADPGHRARLAGAIRRALDRYFASLPR